MPPLRIQASSLRRALDESQSDILSLPREGEWEISRNGDQLTLTFIPPPPGWEMKPIHHKVLKLLRTHKAPDLIEGRFQKFLTEEEKVAFDELRREGKIITRKSSEKFSKALYAEPRPGEEVASPSIKVQPPIPEREAEEYSLPTDGFVVLRSEGAAKMASYDLASRIKSGEIKGIRSFDGFYYIIESSLLEKHLRNVMAVMRANKKMDLSSLADGVKGPRVLVRIAMEFAKEDGLVIEPKKDLYQWVG
ncbi:MAG: hypothetical protein Q8P05_01535 [Candidatus Diapherotrites archaeon]|nr:hypothetical protein [Candidatus Diapherotrites archaeon]